MSELRLILGDQLNAGHSWFRQRDPAVCYLLMEVRSETDYVRHHAQKVLAIFAAMRRFAAALEQAGHRVQYLRIDDPANRQSLAANVQACLASGVFSCWSRMQADEWRVESALQSLQTDLALPCDVVDSEHFLNARDALASAFRQRVPRMETFYRAERQRWQCLLEPDGTPMGGRWNFDTENRARWQGEPAAVDWPQGGHDLRDLWATIRQSGIQTLGEPDAEHCRWPLTRREARTWLQHFITHALPHFGRFQDAMSTRSSTLFHSGLSFALNIKLLNPREVIEAAVGAYLAGKVALPSCEGFVRQILGWREYVRGVYWARMPDYRTLNVLGAQRPLPGWFWTGETQMACLREAITQSLQTAYAHHIQRLMVTGNFAMLAGCHPDEVDAWYLGIYIDAFEWVELPNTRGMSQFADGGIVGSKPYCGSASYMSKQSDYCGSCYYAARDRHGERACPLNSLYWHFHARHADRLSRNPRLAMPYAVWRKLPETEQQATLKQAEFYLSRIETL
ncbi:cryptochrome/photolyase family protein [Chitinimonas sp. BJYL2]|uniref:cryptochrome/photolyase family protein n=1 Tax=Chitinimonas sp. BJYL2 TaxID=2976696 RepID=UPI0022B3550C|nr:cryptochrome/photolyase family protein [Chitinimonas sp. BJYL2]